MPSTEYANTQNKYEALLAQNLEDDTLRVFDELSYEETDTESFTYQVRALYMMILGSSTVFDHLIHTQLNTDEENECEIAREWLREYGTGLDSGHAFAHHLILRIDAQDYLLKED